MIYRKSLLIFSFLFRIDAAGALVRKEITKFWIQKILQRILNKMRLRDKTRQKDISTHCNPMYFLSCMPLCAQQTVQWVDAMCLLQCKELAARHEKTWNTLEEIMMEIQRSKGIVGDHLDEIFNRLYKEFSAFTELYRFTVVSINFFFLFVFTTNMINLPVEQ